jgi:LysM repeat protein
VQEGESFWSIARQYDHAEMDDLMRMNDIPAEALRPGMKLRIPPP